jgi:hypothetical protein
MKREEKMKCEMKKEESEKSDENEERIMKK